MLYGNLQRCSRPLLGAREEELELEGVEKVEAVRAEKQRRTLP